MLLLQELQQKFTGKTFDLNLLNLQLNIKKHFNFYS